MIELVLRIKLIYVYYYFRVWWLWKCMFVLKYWCVRCYNEFMMLNYYFKIIGLKKRKWKFFYRIDILVKSKYLIIFIFFWKEIVKLYEIMWLIRDNNIFNGYLFE